MKPSLFRNYILLSIVVTLGIFLLGTSIAQYLARMQREKRDPPPNMTVFVARLMDQMEAENHLQAFRQIKGALGVDKYRTLWLTDRDGKILDATDAESYTFDWSKVFLPQEVYERAYPRRDGEKPGEKMEMPPPPGPGFGGGGPPGPPPAEVVRLSGPEEYYLVSEFKPMDRMFSEFMWVQLSIIASLIVASLVTFALISWHLRSRAISAENVMSELKRGNLKARFPVQRNDEIGRIMTLFNKMSDEIERLVEKTRANEQARMFIMQELAHDLRTPIASLKSMLETLSEGRGKLPEKISDELFQMSLEEVNYFNRLVEDLLLLAQVLEPEYHAPHKTVRTWTLITEEVERLNAQHSVLGSEKKISLIGAEASQNGFVDGDEHLLRRVFRNLLQNAMTFAKKEIHVQVRQDRDALEFQIQDDGPGFSQDILSSFGERRFSRFINAHSGVHLSVGLGAVIVKKVILVHGGDVQVSNASDVQGRTSGAIVQFRLPLSQGGV